MNNLKYEVKMERFWGLKETVSIHADVTEAIKAIQEKKQDMLLKDPMQEVVFTIVTVKDNH
jgi:hypothetical protein